MGFCMRSPILGNGYLLQECSVCFVVGSKKLMGTVAIAESPRESPITEVYRLISLPLNWDEPGF